MFLNEPIISYDSLVIPLTYQPIPQKLLDYGGGDFNFINQPGSNLTVPINFRGGPTQYGLSILGGLVANGLTFGFGARGIFEYASNPCGFTQVQFNGNPGALIVFENTGT